MWLAEFLYRKKRATRFQIEQEWSRSNISYGKPLNRRTFQETKNKVERLFDTTISYNAQTHEYYFEDAEIFKKNSVHNWLLKTLSVSTTLQKYKNQQERILLEEPATGYFYLSELLEAMDASEQIQLTYHPFDKKPYTTLFSAYCLKAFQQRWYVLGFSDYHQQIRTFALDRIMCIEQTTISYSIPADFNNQLYFKDCYGITYAPHLELHTITLEVSPSYSPYLRTSPIHHSQQEIKKDIFQFTAFFSIELLQKLLSYGQNIKVLSPLSIQQRIKEEAQNMINLYNNP
ncbi:MAG: WYL domain-containing protein [Parabacteroides sp.]|nr:WYL domain-containing protein [Parabacteroides sp.]